jgi:hypothetical protein
MIQPQRVNGFAVPEWHPLESIPRDGRTVEIIDGNGDVFLARCVDNHLQIDCEYLVQPTAWRLLM